MTTTDQRPQPKRTYRDGRTTYTLDGLYHRDDGPAIVLRQGGQSWFPHGVRHRLDGPAVTYSDGRTEWWIAGRQLTNPAIATWETVPDEQRELVADLYEGGIELADAVAAAGRMR